MSFTDEIAIEMMAGDCVPWPCLHGGPVPVGTIVRGASGTTILETPFRARNEALLIKLAGVYGACAVAARRGDLIVGQVRFYPKAVWEMEGGGYLCLQQEFPAGPRDDFSTREFPPLEKLEIRTLKVHCLITVPPDATGSPFRRQGLGTRMVRRLIGWAGENGWKRIEAEALEDLPLIYKSTGSAGRIFWEKLGFRVIGRVPNPHLRHYPEFTAKIEAEARAAGMDVEMAKDLVTMRLDLA